MGDEVMNSKIAPPVLSGICLLAMFLSGCMSQRTVEKELARCPEYFRNNIGQVKLEPLSPLGVIFKGYVSVKDKDGPIHLLPLANRDTVLEEAFHSFELRAGHNRPQEWERFYHDFHSDGTTYKNYGGIVASLAVANIPFLGRMPVSGKTNFHGTISHFEDTAGCFVFMMKGRRTNDPVLLKKCEAVRRFINGPASDDFADAS